MTEKEKKEIFCVASYPESDLHDLTPGTPPDKDFSNAKPPAQTSASVFANYVEPYIRPLTEEDMAFLKERVGYFRCRRCKYRAGVAVQSKLNWSFHG